MSSELKDRNYELGSQKLLVSKHLGGGFCNLLEQKEAITINDGDRLIEKLPKNESNGHTSITVNSDLEAAFILRVYQPEMLIGSNEESVDAIANSLGSQLGLQPNNRTVSAISDRIFDREKVAVVLLNPEVKIDKKLDKLPRNGILVTVAKKYSG